MSFKITLNCSSNHDKKKKITLNLPFVGHHYRDLEQAWQDGPLVVSIWLQTTQWTVGVEVLREFMSQSASRCLLCLARGWAIIHTNGRPDKTELGESNPPSCVSRGALCLPSPCWQPLPVLIPQKKNEEEGKIKCVLQPGVSFTIVCSGVSLELHSFLSVTLNLLTSTYCSVHFTTVSTSCFPSSASTSFSSLVPLTAALLQSFSSPHQPSLLHLTSSPSPLCLHRPSALRVFITVLSGPTSFLECF